jgi:hypothetical protein
MFISALEVAQLIHAPWESAHHPKKPETILLPRLVIGDARLFRLRAACTQPLRSMRFFVML